MSDPTEVTFTQGYVCAVATMVQLFDRPSMAEELLKEVQPIDWRKIDQFDRNAIKKAGITLKRFSDKRKP